MTVSLHLLGRKPWATGPYAYIERGDFMLHVGARQFRDRWDYGFRAWLTLRLPRFGYVIHKSFDRTRTLPDEEMRGS